MRSKEVSIGYLARRTGLAVSAIRYYEERGLVSPERNAGGQRRFKRSDIRRLSFVNITQKFGFTLERIAQLLSTLPEGRTPNARDWAKMSGQFQHELNARIRELEVLRDKLDGCIGCGCLSLDKCALYNPDDSARGRGPGPRYLLGDNPEV